MYNFTKQHFNIIWLKFNWVFSWVDNIIYTIFAIIFIVNYPMFTTKQKAKPHQHPECDGV
ncbi:hypothetical protein B9T30_15475 [Acinetobacter sp. ANC 4973]|nr:hypothetical protein B9T30_15475 [Acinetobacter sp. ANC 4973]